MLKTIKLMEIVTEVNSEQQLVVIDEEEIVLTHELKSTVLFEYATLFSDICYRRTHPCFKCAGIMILFRKKII
jgi:hypothetical protein